MPNAFQSYVALSEPFLGYGPVNHWSSLGSAGLDGWLDGLVHHGLGVAHIELLPWHMYDAINDTTWPSEPRRQVVGAYRYLLAGCVSRKIRLFVSVCNDNRGRGVYPPDVQGRTLAHYEQLAKDSVRFIKGEGHPEAVLVQPVAERHSAAGARIEAYAKQQLGGFELVDNHGAQTQPPPADGFDHVAHHPMGTSRPVPAGALNVSDTGAILRELQHGNVTGMADTTALERYAARCMKKDGNLDAGNFTYYGFGHTHVDYGAMRALGAARLVPAQRRPTSGNPSVDRRDDAFSQAAAAQRVVQRLFLAILGRAADPAGLQSWSAQVQQGWLNKTIHALLTSAEMDTKRSSLTVGELADRAYRELLDRAADRDGRQHTVEMLAAGNGVQRIRGMVLSPEYRERNP